MYRKSNIIYFIFGAYVNVSAHNLLYNFENISNQFTEKEYDIIYQHIRVDNVKLSPALNDSEFKDTQAVCQGDCGYVIPDSQLDNMNGNFSGHFLENTSDHKLTGRLPMQPYLPAYYSPLFKIVAVTLSSVIFVFGILGNILVVIVIARTPSMHTTTNCYLLSLAVADGMVLVSATLTAIPEPFYRVDEWPYGRAMCSLLIFLQYLGIDSSSLSITTFTIERYIAICHPMKAQIMCTVSRAKKIIAALWAFTFLYCSPWLGLTEIVETRLHNENQIQKCQFRLARSSYLVLFMFDLVLFYVTPLTIAAVLYILIARILCTSTTLRQRDSTTQCRSQHIRSLRKTDSKAQVVRMLVVVVATFASLWMPYRVMVVYNSFAQKKYLDIWFLLFSRTMLYINCAINPILYNIMSAKFRRAFHNYLKCWHRHQSAQSQTSSEMLTDGRCSKRQRGRHKCQSKLQLRYGGCSSNGTDPKHSLVVRQIWQSQTGHTLICENSITSATRTSSQEDNSEPIIAEHTV